MLKKISTLFLFNVYFSLILIGQSELKSITISQAQLYLENTPSYISEENFQKGIIDLKQAKTIFRNNELVNENINCSIALSKLYAFVDSQESINYADSALVEILTTKQEYSELFNESSLLKANGLVKLKKMEPAKAIYKDLTKKFQKKSDYKNAIDCEYNLGYIAYFETKYDTSEIHLLNGLKINESIPTNKFTNQLLNLLAVVTYLKGDYQKAINTNLKVIQLLKSLPNLNITEKKSLLSFYSNLAAFYRRKGEYKKALDCLSKIEQNCNYKTSEILKYIPTHFNNKGVLLFIQKNHEAAIQSLKKTIAFSNFPKKKSKNVQKRLIFAYNELADNYIKINQLDSAKYFIDKALSTPIPYKKESTYLILAGTNLLKDEKQLALKNLSTSYQYHLSSKKKNQNYLVKYFDTHAEALQLNDDPLLGLSYTQKALTANCADFKDTVDFYINPPLKNIPYPTDFLKSIHLKSQLLAQLSFSPKDQQAALETYQLATQWIDSLQNSYVLEGSQLFWSNKFKEIYEEAITLNHQFYLKTGEYKYLKTAFDLTEKSKALLLLEGLKDNAGQATASLPDSLTQKEKDLKIAVAFYEKSLQTATEKKQEDRIQLYQGYLADNRLQLARLKEQMEADYPTYYALKYANTNISVEEVQANILDKEQFFINYFLGQQKSYAFVVGKDFQEFLELSSIDTILPKGQTFLKLLKNPRLFQQNAKLAFQNYNQAAYQLYQLVFQEVSTKIPASTNQLIISPDGILNQVPFAALTTEPLPQQSIDFGKLPYLLHRYPIHYAYSANLLANNRAKQQATVANTKMLAFAPSYASNGQIAELRSGSADLMGTKTEIKAIAQYFDGLFEGQEKATKNSFQDNAANFGLLHLAMHGENAPKTGSHLIFTDLNLTDQTDHFLYDYEISNMDLTAQLAVLSACETGVGEYVDGEGVFSLARSFMYAGVPSIAMSLWQVNDLTTSQIIPEFYKNLSEGQDKSSALHQAKQRFLEGAELEYRHPYFWSGFVLLGDGQVLKEEGLFSGLFWGIGLSLILIGAWGYFRRDRVV